MTTVTETALRKSGKRTAENMSIKATK